MKLVENLSSGFREDFLGIRSCSYILQKAPIHHSHVYRRMKISRPLFKKGQPRNISLKSFQNLTSGFGEDFFKEFVLVHKVQKAPIHQSHVYRRIENSRTIFEKVLPRNVAVKLFQNGPAISDKKI